MEPKVTWYNAKAKDPGEAPEQYRGHFLVRMVEGDDFVALVIVENGIGGCEIHRKHVVDKNVELLGAFSNMHAERLEEEFQRVVNHDYEGLKLRLEQYEAQSKGHLH